MTIVNAGSSEFENEQNLGNLFRALDSAGEGKIVRRDLLDALEEVGLRSNDVRLQGLMERLDSIGPREEITEESFRDIVSSTAVLVGKALSRDMIIPDFGGFCAELRSIFDVVQMNNGGAVADYIPQLRNQDPAQFGVSVCTIDGQRFSIGAASKSFCVQSGCKPVNYCLALEENGEEQTHRHVGREPSGHSFNELTLNSRGLPHNPMINSGAIMACSLIGAELNAADRFEQVLTFWEKFSGGQRPGFNNAVYLSERETADRNFALGYFMRENGAFPDGVDLLQTLEFYFQCCSIEVTCESMASVAATLANAGLCPLTGEAVVSASTAKNCLSLMFSCGMYDFSGEFAFKIGLPAKSGVSGIVMVVIPNVMGIAIWSPPLDELGNSVRGLQFCEELVHRYNFHVYDGLATVTDKDDPRMPKGQEHFDAVVTLCWAASQGDLGEIQRMVAKGVDLNTGDYDGRTALHLAASEGHEEVIKYLISQEVDLNPLDRWGGTPLLDARRSNHSEVFELLERHGATEPRENK